MTPAENPLPEPTPDQDGVYEYTVRIDGRPVYKFRGAKLIEFTDDAITDPAELAKFDRRDPQAS
jgi:hypothetical protein